ncbi:hypothetical protein ACFPOH_04440 [Ureibacillus suwonensis]|jgi:hypothetical protein|uniref:Uncharacterized protein n=1 Tax=Ureibacillus suwonensis TaxID=313007 RepID=A0ABW0R8D6_9BACL
MGHIAFLSALIPYLILFAVAYLFFNLIFKIKKNIDLLLEQNKQIVSLLEKMDKSGNEQKIQ